MHSKFYFDITSLAKFTIIVQFISESKPEMLPKNGLNESGDMKIDIQLHDNDHLIH